MSFKIIRNDISKVSADAIVNTANPFVEVGDGVDRAIYEAAGWDSLLAERAKIGDMAPGEAAYTPAFDLDAKYIIHTIGPVWNGGKDGERQTLAACYRNALGIAKELECESVAFPLMSTGTYGFPKDAALKVAISEISDFLFNNEMDVYLVVYDKESFKVSGKAFEDIRSYIGDDEVVESKASSYNVSRRREAARIMSKRRKHISKTSEKVAEVSTTDLDETEDVTTFASYLKVEVPDFLQDADDTESSEIVEEISALDAMVWSDDFDTGICKTESIEEMIDRRDQTWQEYLFRIIDRKGLDDKDVYKKANINRKHFSKIKSNVDYNPSKKTAVAFAIALGLNLDETKDMLLKAGIALTRSSIFDIIIEYCITHDIRDIYEINCILFEYDQPMLGL